MMHFLYRNWGNTQPMSAPLYSHRPRKMCTDLQGRPTVPSVVGFSSMTYTLSLREMPRWLPQTPRLAQQIRRKTVGRIGNAICRTWLPRMKMFEESWRLPITEATSLSAGCKFSFMSSKSLVVHSIRRQFSVFCLRHTVFSLYRIWHYTT